LHENGRSPVCRLVCRLRLNFVDNCSWHIWHIRSLAVLQFLFTVVRGFLDFILSLGFDSFWRSDASVESELDVAEGLDVGIGLVFVVESEAGGNSLKFARSLHSVSEFGEM